MMATRAVPRRDECRLDELGEQRVGVRPLDDDGGPFKSSDDVDSKPGKSMS